MNKPDYGPHTPTSDNINEIITPAEVSPYGEDTAVSVRGSAVVCQKEMSVSCLRREIIRLALPSIGEFVLKMMIGFVDVAFVGRLGAEALAVVGLSWQIMFFFFIITLGINVGTTALVSRYTGGRDEEGVRKASVQSILNSLFFGVMVTLIIVIWGEDIIRVMGMREDLIPITGRFLKLLGISVTPVYILSSVTSILKGSGDTKTPMYIYVFINILNIFLDYSLIFGKFGFLQHGVLGSGIASCVVQFMGGIVGMVMLLSGTVRVKIFFKDLFHLDWDMQKKLWKIGTPAMGENLFFAFTTIFLTWVITRMGPVSMAVHNLLLRAESLSYMPAIGFSVAGGVAVGQALGEENKEKARICTRETMIIAGWVCGIMGLIFYFFPEIIFRIFTDQPQVVEQGAGILKYVAFIQPIQGVMFVLFGCLQGAGDTRASMFIGLLGQWLVRVPLVYILGVTMSFGVGGAWLGMCLDVFARFLLGVFRYRGKEWLEIKV